LQSSLDYTCSCSNGTTISEDVMKTYQQTVPAQMCYYWYDACINATIGANGEGNAAQQFQCTQTRNTTFDESSDGSSSQASGSASGSSTGSPSRTSGASGSATGSSTAAASSGAAVILGTPALAAGLLAVFGLAL
jgi:hypothetical protein